MGLFLLGVLCGVSVLLLAGVVLMPRMGRLFFVENRSLLTFDDTVNRVREQSQHVGQWHITQEKDYNSAFTKSGAGELPFRLVEFKLGNPDHAYRTNKQFPAISTFMPAAIAIVEYEGGDVKIYRKNTGFMGRMFTHDIKQIMQHEVPAELDEMLHGIINKK